MDGYSGCGVQGAYIGIWGVETWEVCVGIRGGLLDGFAQGGYAVYLVCRNVTARGNMDCNSIYTASGRVGW